jgi:hypothetical protein
MTASPYHQLHRKSSVRGAKRRWRELNLPNEYGFYDCALCGFWVHTDSMSIDHIKPMLRYPELANDITNFRPMHKACNQWLQSHSEADFKRPPDFEQRKQRQMDMIIEYIIADTQVTTAASPDPKDEAEGSQNAKKEEIG